MKYDVVIIGAGPGGIFSAYELMKQNNDLKIAVFEAGNPESLADLILKIYENRQSLITKAKNAHSAIIEKYKWDNDSKVFCGVVEEIL